MDYIILGSTPYNEPCAQVESSNYHAALNLEAEHFIPQLQAILLSKFPDSELVIKSKPFTRSTRSKNPFWEIVVYYNPNNADQCEQAFWLDENVPANWEPEVAALLASNEMYQSTLPA